jgi:hypothetical protein
MVYRLWYYILPIYFGRFTSRCTHAARARADRVDSAGTPEFKNAFSQVTNEASVLTGSKLVTIQEFIILMPITILKI